MVNPGNTPYLFKPAVVESWNDRMAYLEALKTHAEA